MENEEKNTITVLNEELNPTLQIRNCFFKESFLIGNFDSDKEMNSFIKKVESFVRQSPEYRSLISYIRSELDLSYCAYLNKLTDDLVGIELHHSPFTLYDYVSIMVNKYIMKEKLFNTFSIAYEVMKLHYENKVGLVPLSKTIHELAHAEGSGIFINREMILGNIETFFEEYEMFMQNEIKNKYNNLVLNSQARKETLLKPLDLFDTEKRAGMISNINNINTDFNKKRLGEFSDFSIKATEEEIKELNDLKADLEEDSEKKVMEKVLEQCDFSEETLSKEIFQDGDLDDFE